MKKVKLTLMGFILLATISSCRKMENTGTPKRLMVSTYAGFGTRDYGDGPASQAKLNTPKGVVTDAAGNVYFSDYSNHRIRKISTDGMVTTFAGGNSGFEDGTGTAARFSYPMGIRIDKDGNLYVADSGNNCIRKITPAGVVSTYAGTGEDGFEDGASSIAKFSFPQYLTIDASKNIYVTDRFNHRIRKITPAGQVTTVVGTGEPYDVDGPVATAVIANPTGIAIDSKDNLYVFQMVGSLGILRKISNGMVSLVAGSTTPGYSDGAASMARIGLPANIYVGPDDNVYMTDIGNHLIRKFDPVKAEVSTFAGLYNIPIDNNSGARPSSFANGPADKALFFSPTDITFDAKGNAYVTDSGNNLIRKISMEDQPNLNPTQAELDQQNWNKPKNWK